MRKQYIKFECQHQKIRRMDDFYVVGGSQKYLYAKFDFCEDWSGERQYAVFTGGGNTYRVEIVDGECEVPWEVLLTKRFFVGCEAGQRITSNAAEVVVHPCGAPEETVPPRKPTPTLQSQIGELEELDTEHKENLVSAINELDDKLEAKASWEQNDPTQPDYIKGRTHWVEDYGLVEILPECKPVYGADEGWFLIANAPLLEAGKTYTVSWNGMEYTCIGIDGTALGGAGTVVLGDFYTASGGQVGDAPTGEPFALTTNIVDDGNGYFGPIMMIVPLDGTTELTISITASVEIVHKLDNKFLDLDWLPISKKTDLIKKQTVEIDGFGGIQIGTENFYQEIADPFGAYPAQPAIGATATVEIDGATYTAVCCELDGQRGFVNPNADPDDITSILIGGKVSFLWIDTGSAQGYLVLTKTPGTYTVNLYAETAEKMPEEFLPSSVVTRDELGSAVEDYLAENPVDVPTKLPNPHALTINGISYDGSKPVDLKVEGVGGDWVTKAELTALERRMDEIHTDLSEATGRVEEQMDDVARDVADLENDLADLSEAVNAALGSYITDVAALVGGDA